MIRHARRRGLRIWLCAFFVAVAAVGVAALLYGRAYWAANTAFSEGSVFVCIEPNSPFDSVADQMSREGVLADVGLFKRFARIKGLDTKRYGGRYEVRKGMTTRIIANMLAAHRQTPVRLVIPSVRTREEMASRIAGQLWLDSSSLAQALWDSTLASRYGFTVESFPAMIVPNTYEVYWDVTQEALFDRLHREWKAFWSAERESLLASLGLTETEVATLASIVQEEIRYPDELRRVAGVYLNRLHRGMLLKADPTVKFAVGDFTLRRILFSHTQVESPYNTYLHAGLPPGPIVFPEIRSVDAVLNYEPHDYLYFCAKDDFSGRHNFSRTGEQHMRYARKYQQALRAQGIVR